MKRIAAALILTAVTTILLSGRAQAQSVPKFTQDFWQNELDGAKGKVRRGAGLAVMGLASMVPIAFLIERTIDTPKKYLGWTTVMGIATLGMTLHGFGSVGFGLQQKRRAADFIKTFKNDPPNPNYNSQQKYYLYSRCNRIRCGPVTWRG